MVNSLKLCALALSLVSIAKGYSVDSVDGETTTEVPPPPDSFTTIKNDYGKQCDQKKLLNVNKSCLK